MIPFEFTFTEDFNFEYNDKCYSVCVEGVSYKDEYDTNDRFNEIKRIFITDENGDRLTEAHDDYSSIIEEILNRDYTPQYQDDDCYSLDYME